MSAAPAQEVSSPSPVPADSIEGHRAYSPAQGESTASVKEEDLKGEGSSKRNSDVSETVVKVEKSGVETSAEPSSDDSVPKISRIRKNFILVCLAGAQFFDIFNACAAIVALPALGADLGFSANELQWVLSAYTLTFAAFMLISGRISDMFHPKPVFVVGFLWVGLLSIPIAASVNPIMTIVLRAAQGIGAAMNVPSAVAMIRLTWPDPVERGRAYSIYGAFGATGTCVGFIVGGVLASLASWRWVFYLLAIIIIPFALASWFVLPNHTDSDGEKKALDYPGVFSLTAGLILFVFAISEGSATGWGSARVIAPLIISIFLFGGFLFIERIVKDPALPPRTWTNKNFTPLFFYGWSIYWWAFACELQLVQIFTDLWHHSTLNAAIRCLPFGIAAGVTAYGTGFVAPYLSRRVLLISGQLFMAIGSILFALANEPSKYWPYMVPAMIVGMLGVGVALVGSTIVVMDGVRDGEEGVVSAVMFTSYQVGATLGLAIVSSITLAVNQGRATDAVSQYVGYSASFWSLLGMNGIEIIISLLFVRN